MYNDDGEAGSLVNDSDYVFASKLTGRANLNLRMNKDYSELKESIAESDDSDNIMRKKKQNNKPILVNNNVNFDDEMDAESYKGLRNHTTTSN